MNKAAFVKSTALILLVCFAVSLVLYGRYVAASVSFGQSWPPANYYSATDTPTFYFTPTSNVSDPVTCTLFLNDTSYGTNPAASNNTNSSIFASSIPDGFYLWYINCTDIEGIYQTSSQGITIDTAQPTAAITYSKNGGANYYSTIEVKNSDTLIIKATFNEDITDSPIVQLTIDNAVLSATNMTKVSSTVYTYSLDVPSGDIAAAAVSLGIGTDLAGNIITAAPTSGPIFTIDNSAPLILAIIFDPTTGWRKIGETVVMIIDADFNGYTAGAITVNGKSVTGFIDTNDSNYNVTYTVESGDTFIDDAAELPISVVLTDAAGNSNTAYNTSLPAGNSPGIDGDVPICPSPTITEVEHPENQYVSGTTIYYTNGFGPDQNGSFYVVIAASDAGSGISNVTFPTTVSAGSADSSASYNLTYNWNSVDVSNYAPATITCYDNAGNTNTATFNVYSDTTNPTLTSVSLDDYIVKDGATITVTSDGADAGSGLSACNAYWSNDTSWDSDDDLLVDLGNDCDGDITVPAGAGTFYVIIGGNLGLGDNVGYFQSNKASSTITVDNTAPVISSLSDNGATDKKAGNLVTITFAVVEEFSSIGVNPAVQITQNDNTSLIGGATYSGRAGTGASADPYIYTYNYTVPAGNYPAVKIKVNVADDSENSAAEVILEPAFNIDNAAPTAPIAPVSSAGAYVNAAEYAAGFNVTVNFSLTGAPEGGSVELLLGSSPFSSPKVRLLDAADISAGVYTFAVLSGELGADGSKNLSANASDVAGNSGPKSENLSFTLDTAAPSVAITAPLTGASVKGDYNITFTDTEPTNAECSINNSAWVSCTSGATTLANITGFAGLPQGTFTLYLRDTDAAGNIGTDNETGIIKDSLQPVVILTSIETSPTSTSPIHMTATFNESVTGFILGDISVGNGEVIAFSGSGTTYTFNVTPSDNGLVTVDVSAGVASDAAGNLNLAAAQFNITYDSVAPETMLDSDNAGFNYVNESDEIVKYGGGYVTIPGYVSDSSPGLANWSLEIYVNSAYNSTACFDASGESIINDTLCLWNTTIFCPVGSECRNVTLVLRVFDTAGNQNNISNDTNRINPIVIDNKYPVINETANVDFTKDGMGRWNATFNVSDEHLNQVSTFILDADNYTIVTWNSMCNIGNSSCMAPESGTFLQEWNLGRYTLDGSLVPVHYKFNFDPIYGNGEDWYLNAIPGCLKLNVSSEYECGQQYDSCTYEGEEDCKAHRWWLVYNMTFDETIQTEKGILIGITQENWCIEEGGCVINSSMIVLGETKFTPQQDKYLGQGSFEQTNLTEISLESAPELINVPIDGGYNLLVQAQDYVWTSDSLWENLFTVDLTPPQIHFSWWNTTGFDGGFETPMTMPDYRNFTEHADIFFSPLERTILFAVNVTDNYEVNYVLANLSEFDAFPMNGTCNDILYLAYNDTTGLWEGSCTLDSFTEADIMDYNNGSNVASFNVNFIAGDIWQNDALFAYNTSSYTNPPAQCNGGDSDECIPAFTPINLHDLGVPDGNGPGGECMRIGALSTNFSQELDFTDINFILQIDLNLSCVTSEMVNISDFTTMMLWNFSSLDFSSPATGAKLGNLMNAIEFDIQPPNSFGSSRIYVNSSAFSELNSTTIISIFHLPFTTQPDITADVDAAGFDNTSVEWATNGYESAFGSITGNLTFTVNGFSGYDILDNESPIITADYPSEDEIVTSSTINLNFEVNGTGNKVSRVQIVIDETSYSYNPLNDPEPLYDVTCTEDEPGSELYSCNKSVTLEDGEYLAEITAWDFGGESGNNETLNLNFSVDTTAPVTTITLRIANSSIILNNSKTNSAYVNVTLACADSVSGCNTTLYCVNASGNACTPGTPWALFNISNVSTTYIRYYSIDNINHSENVKYAVVTIDWTKPIITEISVSGEDSLLSTGTATFTVTTNESASCWYKDVNFTASNSTGGATLLSGTGTSHEFEIPFSGDGHIGPYYVSCRDTAGNSMTTANSTGQIDVTVKESTGGSSSTASGAYGNMTANGTMEIIFLESTATLGRNSYFKFPVKNVWHKCTLTSVGNGSITFVVESTPQTVIIKEGESKAVDVTGDGAYDVNITVVKIYLNGATVKFSPVSQPVTATPVTPPVVTPPVQPPVTPPVVTPPAQNTSAVKNTTEPAKERKPLSPIWAYLISVAILVLIAFLVYGMISRKKEPQY